jgi:hypothetical protein
MNTILGALLPLAIIIITLLLMNLRGKNTVYKDKQRPLSYIELSGGKPLVIKIDDNLYYSISHMTVIDYCAYQAKYITLARAFEKYEKEKKPIMMAYINKYIIDLLLSLCDGTVKKYTIELRNRLLNNIDLTLSVLEEVDNYVWNYKKKIRSAAAGFQAPTVGGRSLSDYMRRDSMGKPQLIPMFGKSSKSLRN